MTELKIIQNEHKELEINRDNYDHYNEERLLYKAVPGVSEELVRLISKDKNEPDWMLAKRLSGLKEFLARPTPEWGPNLKELDLTKII